MGFEKDAFASLCFRSRLKNLGFQSFQLLLSASQKLQSGIHHFAF